MQQEFTTQKVVVKRGMTMKYEDFVYVNQLTGKDVHRFMAKGEVNMLWEVTTPDEYTPITVFNPNTTPGIDTRKQFHYRIPTRVWNKHYSEAIEGITRMASRVYKYYEGSLEKDRRVIRNGHETAFNPIFEWDINGSLYIVEWHARAKFIELRKATRIGYKEYSTARMPKALKAHSERTIEAVNYICK